MDLELGMPSWLQENDQRRERWAHLTEGVSDDYTRKVLETLLDNTKRWINEESKTQNIATFTTYAFPLIRRIFPNLIASELVSVQPLTMPTGMIFYLDFKYGTNIAPTKAGDRIDWQGPEATKFNRLYASGKVRGEQIGTGDGENTAFRLQWYPVEPSSIVVYVDSTVVNNVDVDPMTGEVVFHTAPADGAVITADYDIVTEGMGDNGNTRIPEIDFDMTSDQIGTETKKLRARWTIEAQQDLMAYHGLDAETELTAVLGDEIRREIDQMIVHDVYAGATAGNVNWSEDKPADWVGDQDKWDQTIWHALIDADNLVFKKRLRNTNWIVCGPDEAARLEKLNGFQYAPGASTADGGTIQMGLRYQGTLRGRWRVYVDPFFPANKYLLGYKGTSFFEAGYVYAPYIPLYVTPVFMDPNDFKPRRGVMTRFGRKMISGDNFATVTVVTK